MRTVDELIGAAEGFAASASLIGFRTDKRLAKGVGRSCASSSSSPRVRFRRSFVDEKEIGSVAVVVTCGRLITAGGGDGAFFLY